MQGWKGAENPSQTRHVGPSVRVPDFSSGEDWFWKDKRTSPSTPTQSETQLGLTSRMPGSQCQAPPSPAAHSLQGRRWAQNQQHRVLMNLIMNYESSNINQVICTISYGVNVWFQWGFMGNKEGSVWNSEYSRPGSNDYVCFETDGGANSLDWVLCILTAFPSIVFAVTIVKSTVSWCPGKRVGWSLWREMFGFYELLHFSLKIDIFQNWQVFIENGHLSLTMANLSSCFSTGFLRRSWFRTLWQKLRQGCHEYLRPRGQSQFMSSVSSLASWAHAWVLRG